MAEKYTRELVKEKIASGKYALIKGNIDKDSEVVIKSKDNDVEKTIQFSNSFQNNSVDYGGGYRIASTPAGWIVFYSGIKVGHGNNEAEAKQIIRDDSKKRFYGRNPHEPVANCAFQNGRTKAMQELMNKAGKVGVRLENEIRGGNNDVYTSKTGYHVFLSAMLSGAKSYSVAKDSASAPIKVFTDLTQAKYFADQQKG